LYARGLLRRRPAYPTVRDATAAARCEDAGAADSITAALAWHLKQIERGRPIGDDRRPA
jgi:hypothetical protein